MLRELNGFTLAPQLGDAVTGDAERLAHSLPLAAELSFPLDLRAQSRRARVERLQSLELPAELVVSRGVVPGGNGGQVATQCLLPLLLLRDLARDLRQLLHRALHLGQPSLQLANGLEGESPSLAERLHPRWHLDQ